MRRSTHKTKEVLKSCLYIAICFLFSSSLASAENTGETVCKHAFDIGLGVSHLDYDEDSIDVEIAGPMYALVGSYTYHNKIMMHASLEYSRGDLDYDGFTQAGEPAENDTQDWIIECRGLIGYDYLLWENHVATPFFGVGYRYWSDDIKGPGGLERNIEYWYSPLGVRTHSPLSDNWTWGMSLEYDFFWFGKVRSHTRLPDPEVTQDSGYGVRFSLRLRREFANDCALSIEPYVRYWQVDESEESFFDLPGSDPEEEINFIRTVEPENETTSYGLRIIYEF